MRYTISHYCRSCWIIDRASSCFINNGEVARVIISAFFISWRVILNVSDFFSILISGARKSQSISRMMYWFSALLSQMYGSDGILLFQFSKRSYSDFIRVNSVWGNRSRKGVINVDIWQTLFVYSRRVLSEDFWSETSGKERRDSGLFKSECWSICISEIALFFILSWFSSLRFILVLISVVQKYKAWLWLSIIIIVLFGYLEWIYLYICESHDAANTDHELLTSYILGTVHTCIWSRESMLSRDGRFSVRSWLDCILFSYQKTLFQFFHVIDLSWR